MAIAVCDRLILMTIRKGMRKKTTSQRKGTRTIRRTPQLSNVVLLSVMRFLPRQTDAGTRRPGEPYRIVPADGAIEAPARIGARNSHGGAVVEPGLVERDVAQIGDVVDAAGDAVLADGFGFGRAEAQLLGPQRDPYFLPDI